MDDKKRKITLSAINVFQEKGIEKATVSDIVRGAEIAQGTFYLYFPSKLSVMPAIADVLIEKTLHHFHDKMNFDVDFPTQLKQFIDIVFDYTKNYHQLYAILYVGMGSIHTLDQWENIYEPYYLAVSEMINYAQAKREIKQQTDPKNIAIMLIGFIEAAADQSYLYDHENQAKIEAKKHDIIDFILHGLLPQE